MIFGYASGTDDQQSLKLQVDALKEYGCEKIFREKQNAPGNKPELERMILQLRKNDMVVTLKLGHMVKSLKDLVSLINLFKEIEVDFVCLRDNIDTRTTYGKMFYKVIVVLSEFEKGKKMKISVTGQRPAGTRQRKGGRPKGLSGESIMKARKAKELYENDSIPVADIARLLGIGKTTLYRYLHYTGAGIVHQKETGPILPDENKGKNRIRKELFNKLLESEAFWSYSNVRYEKIPDDVLIQKVMEELDIGDIRKLFSIYNKNYLRRIWKNRMVIQDPYFRSLNILLAKLFFNIKKPEEYIRKVQKEFQYSATES